MEILITGGNGLVGHHLITALQQHGITALQQHGGSVRVLVLPPEDTTWLKARGVAVYRGDICQPGTLTAPMRSVDTVFHLAALHGVWRPLQDYYAVNVAGTAHVCRAALAAGVRRFVHVSSWMAYGMVPGRPVSEDFPLAPWHDPYWVTKAEGDKLVQRMIAQEQLPAVIIRPGTIFGPGDRLNFGRIADRLRTGKGLIVGSGRNALPLVYVTDMVQGLLLAVEHERAVGQAYNITNDQPLTQKEFLCAVAQEIGARPPRLHVPYRALYASAYIAEQAARLTHAQHPLLTRHGVDLFGIDNRHAIEKARRELGYRPRVPLREGVRLAAAWYRQQHLPARSSVAAAAR
jgi:nucleoside-diphosphate-sugar epimerase